MILKWHYICLTKLIVFQSFDMVLAHLTMIAPTCNLHTKPFIQIPKLKEIVITELVCKDNE